MAAGIGESILFIASLLVAAGMVGVFGAIINDAADETNEESNRAARGLETSLVMVSDPDSVATSPLVVYAKNDGSTTLSVDDLYILFDGQASTSKSFDVLSEADDTAWIPGSILEITISDATVTSQEHRVRIVTQTGQETSLLFHG